MKSLLNHAAVKKLAKEYDKRVGGDFMACLEQHIRQQIIKACGTHNGSKKTLGAEVAGWIGLK
jgi:hypothetical protein